jgi:hypothetical protein
LTIEEIQLVKDLALPAGDAEMPNRDSIQIFNIAGYRSDREPCQEVDSCASACLFSRGSGHERRLVVDLRRERIVRSATPSCDASLTTGEAELARVVAEADPIVQDVLEERDGRYGHAKLWISPRGLPGHRYVAAIYSLDGGSASGLFVVNMTTLTLCNVC